MAVERGTAIDGDLIEERRRRRPRRLKFEDGRLGGRKSHTPTAAEQSGRSVYVSVKSA